MRIFCFLWWCNRIAACCRNAAISSVLHTVSFTSAKPAINTDDITVDITKDSNDTDVAIVTWSVMNPGSVTHILMKVCEVNYGECIEHEIGDFTSTSQVNIPKGQHYEFSFYLYDGAELVATQERATTLETGISGVIFLYRCSIWLLCLHINYIIVMDFAFDVAISTTWYAVMLEMSIVTLFTTC